MTERVELDREELWRLMVFAYDGLINTTCVTSAEDVRRAMKRYQEIDWGALEQLVGRAVPHRQANGH